MMVEWNDRELGGTPVIENLGGQPGSNLLELVFHPIDDGQWVGAVAHDDDSTHRFGAALIERSTPDGGPQGHSAHLAHCDGYVIGHTHNGVFDVVEALDEAKPAYDVLGAIDLDGSCSNIDV